MYIYIQSRHSRPPSFMFTRLQIRLQRWLFTRDHYLTFVQHPGLTGPRYLYIKHRNNYLRVLISVHCGEVSESAPQQLQLHVTLGVLLPQHSVLHLQLQHRTLVRILTATLVRILTATLVRILTATASEDTDGNASEDADGNAIFTKHIHYEVLNILTMKYPHY